MMFFIFYVKDYNVLTYQKSCLNHFQLMTTLTLKAPSFLVLVKHSVKSDLGHLEN